MGLYDQLLAACRQSVRGLSQDEMRAIYKKNGSGSRATGGSGAIELKKAANTLADELLDAWPLMDSASGPDGEWVVGSIMEDGNVAYVDISYSGSFERASLYPQGYPDGLANIWSLLNTGYAWRKGHYAFKTVRGITEFGRSFRRKTGFIDKVLRNFEARYGGQYTYEILNNTIHLAADHGVNRQVKAYNRPNSR